MAWWHPGAPGCAVRRTWNNPVQRGSAEPVVSFCGFGMANEKRGTGTTGPSIPGQVPRYLRFVSRFYYLEDDTLLTIDRLP